MRHFLATIALLCVSVLSGPLRAQASWPDRLAGEPATRSVLSQPAPPTGPELSEVSEVSPGSSLPDLPVTVPPVSGASIREVTNPAPTTGGAEPEEPETLRTRSRGSLRESSGPVFDRGDANGDGDADVSDAVHVLRFLLSGGDEPLCEKAADFNDDGAVDVSDALALLGATFLGRHALPPPRGSCGLDPTADALTCEAPGSCAE